MNGPAARAVPSPGVSVLARCQAVGLVLLGEGGVGWTEKDLFFGFSWKFDLQFRSENKTFLTEAEKFSYLKKSV